MSLITEIGEFFKQYDDRNKKLEYCAEDFSRLLHRLADDLSDDERETINQTCAVLDTHIEEIIDLNEKKALRSAKEEAELRSIKITVRNIIADFRHGNILKRYQQRVGEEENKGRAQPSIAAAEAPERHNASVYNDSHPHPKEAMLEAVRIARKMSDDPIEILHIAAELHHAATAHTKVGQSVEAARGSRMTNPTSS